MKKLFTLLLALGVTTGISLENAFADRLPVKERIDRLKNSMAANKASLDSKRAYKGQRMKNYTGVLGASEGPRKTVSQSEFSQNQAKRNQIRNENKTKVNNKVGSYKSGYRRNARQIQYEQTKKRYKAEKYKKQHLGDTFGDKVSAAQGKPQNQ
ncbi:MAG TPA: hypothetical protein DCL21_01055 [Alphaproteobacteria bacterium]|nr:hypothetical protein [Alphaproteobacteria bacterium]